MGIKAELEFREDFQFIVFLGRLSHPDELQ
jgi:hypothetical protein